VTILHFLIATLACFRFSVLLADDDGPYGMFRRFRGWLKREAKEKPAVRRSEVHKGVECIRCDSVWFGVLIAIYALCGWRSVWIDGLLLALALSGAAILWNRAFPKR
jgi:hypothetical protein